MGDPNTTRLMNKIIDRIDGTLTQNGLEFNPDRSWTAFHESVRALIFNNYVDATGGDSEYDPDAPSDDEEEDEESGDENEEVSLGSEDDIV